MGCYGFSLGKKYDVDNIFKDNIIKNNNMISMMLEQNSGAGDYLQVAQSNWPTEGYIFNKERSGCENGGELSWDDTRKTVVMMGNISDKCYVYFDKVSIKLLADYIKSQYTGIQGENNIYYHDGTLENGISDNSYRYAGASEEVNNFVCFGSTATPCPNDNLYRIIGVIDGKVKLIKANVATSALLGTDGDYNDSIGDQNYDDSTSIDIYYWNSFTVTNTWSESKLNKTNLNTNFLNNIGDAWASKIAITTWKVGGNTSANISKSVPAVAYQNEIVNPQPGSTSTTGETEYNAKIGLMYASDYGFAASPSAWTTHLYNYNKNANWMYMGYDEWTISRSSTDSDLAFALSRYGTIDDVDCYVTRTYKVRPCFSLESFVTYKSGTGTINDPIVIN